MKRTPLIIGLTVVAIAGAAAMVQAKGGRGEGMDHANRPTFEQLDADGDGKVTPAEMAAIRKTRFDLMDTDKNGSLSVEEMIAAREADHQARMAKMIEKMDTNKNGTIEFDEMGQRGGDKGDRAAKMLKRVDTDNDGAISKAEFDAAETKMAERQAHRTEKHKKRHGGQATE